MQTCTFARNHQTWSGNLESPPNQGNLGAIPLLVGDVNGDERADRMNIKDVNTNVDIFYFRKEGVENLLEKVKNGYGHEIRFSYKKLTGMGTFHTRGSLTAYPLLTMQLPMYVVWEQRAQDGVLTEAVSQYSYTGLRLHRAGKGFLVLPVSRPIILPPVSQLFRRTSLMGPFIRQLLKKQPVC